MLSFKIFALVLLASSQSVFSAEADWEVLNMAIDNILAANPTVLANSISNILSGFLPTDTTSPTPVTLPTMTPRPSTQPASMDIRPQPMPQSTDPASSMAQLFIRNPALFQMMVQSMMPPATATQAPATISQPVPANNPVIAQILTSNPSNGECDCKQKQKSLAEFLVNVPCPTTTEKPPKSIVVKVPCPTTTTETPCPCQCCPCNPCPSNPCQSNPQKSKKSKKQEKVNNGPSATDSEESQEIKTVFKTYEVPRKSNAVRSYFKYDHEDWSSEESR